MPYTNGIQCYSDLKCIKGRNLKLFFYLPNSFFNNCQIVRKQRKGNLKEIVMNGRK